MLIVSSKMQRMARASVPSDNISTLSMLDPFNTNNKIGDSTQLPSGLRFIMNSQDNESKIKLTLRTKFSDKESNNQVDEDGSGSGAMAAKAQSHHSSHDKQAEDTTGASHPNRRAVLNRRSSSRDPRYVCRYVCLYICTVCMYVCMFACIYVLYVCMYGNKFMYLCTVCTVCMYV